MGRILVQFFALIALVLGMWFGLSKVDWIQLFQLKKFGENTEKKIGDIFWKMTKETETELKQDSVVLPINKLLDKLCNANNIPRSEVKLHIIRKDEVNAFAFPDDHLVIYSGLIQACDNEGELCGVMAHELGHMQKKHVMKKLVAELGLSAIISIAGGGAGSEVLKEAVKLISSSAYDRSMEKEADLAAVEYLIQANMDPQQFATFLFKLANTQKMPKGLSWISSHPESEERAKYVLEYAKTQSVHPRPVLSNAEWAALKNQTKGTGIR